MAPYCFSCHPRPTNIIKSSQKTSKLKKMTTNNKLSTIINSYTSAHDVLMMLCCALFTIIIYLLTAAKFSPIANIFRSTEPSRPSRCNIFGGYCEEAQMDSALECCSTCSRNRLLIHKNLPNNYQPSDQHTAIQPSCSTNPPPPQQIPNYILHQLEQTESTSLFNMNNI